MKNQFALLTVLIATSAAAFGQAPAVISPQSIHIDPNSSTSITITSPYNDCVMTINARSSDPTVATVSPPLFQGLGPAVFSVKSATFGETSILFLITGEPGGCVDPTSYTVPLAIVVSMVPTYFQNIFTGSGLEPVSTSTGELFGYDERPDLDLGGPLPLVFRRYYAAYLVSNGVASSAGANWMHNFDVKLATSGNSATVTLFRGKTVQFTKSGTAWQLSSTERRPYQLVATAGGFQFLDPVSNLLYSFDANGALTQLADRSGNKLTVTQAPGGVGPATVSDGLGRTLTFTYNTTSLIKVQDQAGRFVTFQYNSGNLVSFTDANGKVSNYAYTTAGPLSGLMTAETRPLANRPFSQTYDASGRVATQSDSLGNSGTFTYAAAGNGATVTEPLGVSFTQTYDNLRNLISQTDPGGGATTITYDPNSRPLTVTDRVNAKTSVTWDSAGGLPATHTDALGNVTTNTYASSTAGGFTFYDLAAVKFADGTSIAFTRDANGNILSLTDQADKVWGATWNSRGQIATLTNPSGAVTAFAYGNDGTLTSVRTDSGDTTQIAYDLSSRPNAITFPDGNKRQFQYDALSNLLRATDERNGVTSTSFDDNNNLHTGTDAVQAVGTYAYDTNDRPVSYTDPLGKTTRATYDAAARLQSVTNPAGNSITYAYDALNRVTSAVDAAGKGNSYTWDAEGRLMSRTDALGRATKLSRDALGRATTLTTPNNETYTRSYDKLSRLVSTTNPLSQARQYAYDPRGLPQSITLPGGISTSMNLNELGLVTSLTDPNGSIWTRTFDKMGRLAAAADPLGQSTSVQWDSRQRPSGLTLPNGSVQLAYDAASNLTAQTYSDGTKLTYVFDADNRLTSASGVALGYDLAGNLNLSNGLAVAHDDAQRISSITYAPGKSVTYGYNNRGLLTTITDWVNGSFALAYDDARQLISMVFPNGVREDYTYDPDGRLATIKTSRNGTAIASTTLRRDAAGKTIGADRSAPQVPDVPVYDTYAVYNQAHESDTQTYDALGRVTATPARSYTWDLASRLTSYSGVDGTASFTYDALGQRISRTAGGVTQNYVVNYALGLPAVSVVRTANADLRYYVWLPNGMLLESIEAADNSRHFFHFDETGTTIFLTGDAGTVTDTYATTPYGEVFASTGSTPNPFTFQGRFGVMQEGATGLYYMRARYYDSVLARFLSRDLIASSDPLRVNPYQYALNNPMGFGDPRGLDSVPLPPNVPITYPGLNPSFPLATIPGQTVPIPYPMPFNLLTSDPEPEPGYRGYELPGPSEPVWLGGSCCVLGPSSEHEDEHATVGPNGEIVWVPEKKPEPSSFFTGGTPTLGSPFTIVSPATGATPTQTSLDTRKALESDLEYQKFLTTQWIRGMRRPEFPAEHLAHLLADNPDEPFYFSTTTKSGEQIILIYNTK